MAREEALRPLRQGLRYEGGPIIGKRIAMVLLGVVCAIPLLWIAAHFLANRSALRVLATSELADRIEAIDPAAEISTIFRVSWLGCIEIPTARVCLDRFGRSFEVVARDIQACPRIVPLFFGRIEPSGVTVKDLTITRRTCAHRTERRHGGTEPAGEGLRLWTAADGKGGEGVHIKVGAVSFPGIRVLDSVGPLSIKGHLDASADATGFSGTIGMKHGPGMRGLSVDLSVDHDDTGACRIRTQVNVPAFPLRKIPLEGIRDVVRGGNLIARIQAEAIPAARTAELTFNLGVMDLVVLTDRLAKQPVGPLSAHIKGAISYDGRANEITLRPSVARVGHIEARCEGLIGLSEGLPFEVNMDIGPIHYRALIESLPAAFRPPEEAIYADGPMAFHGKLSGPARARERWVAAVSLDLAGLKRTAGAKFDPAGPFSLRIPDDDNSAVAIHVGPSNPGFIPLGRVPPTLLRAILLAEDCSFYGHSGFDFQEMALALDRNVREERPARGGSTITQQLAKNLFLDKEKTYARKVKEALLALELEATLSKSRILEIYLNVVEWGPRVRGIGPATSHYFGKSPEELSPKEAAFLATILPNPIRYHLYYDRGGLTARWEGRVGELLGKLAAVGAISQEEYAGALATTLVFARP